MKELESIRKEVLLISSNIIEQVITRKHLVGEIQRLKSSDNKTYQTTYKNFSPQRELIVFKEINGLSKLSLKELLSLSLLIESHAQQNGDYPSWSEGCHIQEKNAVSSSDISYLINPILLASTFKSRYDALPLNLEFREILDNCIK